MEPLKTIPKSRKPGAFSLIEILVVLAIVSVIMTMSVIAFNKVAGSTELTGVGDQFMNLLNRAQQGAIADNHNVEFRIYSPSASEDAETHWTILLARKTGDEQHEAVAPPFYLPLNISISKTPALSTLVSGLEEQKDVEQLIKNEKGEDDEEGAAYTAFRFFADGSTDLPANSRGDTWHLTLVSTTSVQKEESTFPPNFYTIRVDPFTGRATVFRP